MRAIVAGRQYGLTTLTADDIPWEDDGTRDRPEERSWFQRRFREELAASGRDYVFVEGPPERRLATATAAIDRLRWRRASVGAPSVVALAPVTGPSPLRGRAETKALVVARGLVPRLPHQEQVGTSPRPTKSLAQPFLTKAEYSASGIPASEGEGARYALVPERIRPGSMAS